MLSKTITVPATVFLFLSFILWVLAALPVFIKTGLTDTTYFQLVILPLILLAALVFFLYQLVLSVRASEELLEDKHMEAMDFVDHIVHTDGDAVMQTRPMNDAVTNNIITFIIILLLSPVLLFLLAAIFRG